MNFNTLPRKVIIEKGKDVILKCLIELRVKILKFLVFNFVKLARDHQVSIPIASL